MNTPSIRSSVSQLPALNSQLIVAFLAAMVPALGLANGTRLPNQNAEATARGNAFVATADNPSAIYYNPAGLTQLPGLQIQSDSYAILASYDYTPAGGGPTVKADRSVAVVPQLYVSFTPENSPLSYGLGVYSPFGQSSEWPDNSGFRTVATRNEIIFITVAPTIAWKICDQLSVGAGLQINRVEADLRRGLSPFPGDQFKFEGDDTSLGYNLGVMWKPSERHVFGLNYQSRSTSHFKGDVSLTFPPTVSGPASVDLPFPDIITLGYSWRPTPQWNLEVAVDRTNWDLVNTAVLTSTLLPPQTIPFEWEASYYYLFGVTRYLADGWRVSAGYCYSGNSVPDATFNPAVPDMSRHLASVGVGRTFGSVSCFFTYQHGFKASRTVQSTPAAITDGTYESAMDAVSLSFRYAF
ncbi:MAG: outer membrane protein transport protein [Opitutaceae bacterium]|nr:outer membrane protein transport protein [Opitutaceae bacterium]